MSQENPSVDWRRVVSEIWKRKKLFTLVISITFVLSSLYILTVPRNYSTSTEMAPEVDGASTKGMLGSLASSFGLDIAEMQSSDAITPLLYPELMNDNGFVAGLFNVKVQTKDGKIKTDYYHYLKEHHKASLSDIFLGMLDNIFSSDKKENIAKGNAFNPYYLSKKDDEILGVIRKNITFKVDKKTGLITIFAQAQDPLVCKTIADSTRLHLQAFITQYRTSKARKDLEYYTKLTADAKQAYERQRQLYGSYADANADLVLESFKSKQEDIENEMQLRFTAYSTLNTQLQAAKAKVQEKTPAFTLVKGASVPIRPSSPKRMIFVIGMVFLAFMATSVYVLKDIVLTKK